MGAAAHRKSYGSVVSVHWQPHLNQIALGTTEGTRVLYDPKMSQKGACLCVGKHKRAADYDVAVNPGMIHNPHALPMYKLDPGGHTELSPSPSPSPSLSCS